MKGGCASPSGRWPRRSSAAPTPRRSPTARSTSPPAGSPSRTPMSSPPAALQWRARSTTTAPPPSTGATPSVSSPDACCEGHSLMNESYALHVNGERREVRDAWIGESLLYVLRERLGLLGAKGACEQGECGSCSVLVDGGLVCSCLVLAASAVGQEIVTVEGIAERGAPSDLQRAF